MHGPCSLPLQPTPAWLLPQHLPHEPLQPACTASASYFASEPLQPACIASATVLSRVGTHACWRPHRMYAFDVHCNSYFPLFLLLYGALFCCCSDLSLHALRFGSLRPFALQHVPHTCLFVSIMPVGVKPTWHMQCVVYLCAGNTLMQHLWGRVVLQLMPAPLHCSPVHWMPRHMQCTGLCLLQVALLAQCPGGSCAVLQLLLAPLLLWRSVVAALLSNALYAAALGYYHYLSFLGYSALPFLEHTEVSCPAEAHLPVARQGASLHMFHSLECGTGGVPLGLQQAI